MGCQPVRGDNPRALASGLSCVHVDKHGITILHHLHQCRPCTSRDICAKVVNNGIIYVNVQKLNHFFYHMYISVFKVNALLIIHM